MSHDNVIDFPGVPQQPVCELRVDDHDRHSGPYPMDRLDRQVFDVDLIDVQDDSLDEPVTLPVKVGTHYSEPTIELGRYSLTPDAARALAAVLAKFAGCFREVTG